MTSALIPWTPGELAAIDVLRGVSRGAIVTDEFTTETGDTTSQMTVMTPRGAVVLTSSVPDVEIPVLRRIVIRQTVNRVRRALDLGPVSVRYFGPPRWIDEETIFVQEVNRAHPTFDEIAPEGMQRIVAGITSPMCPYSIFLHESLSGDALLRTIAHEIRHVDQLWGRAGHVPETERETDAARFAEEWMATR